MAGLVNNVILVSIFKLKNFELYNSTLCGSTRSFLTRNDVNYALGVNECASNPCVSNATCIDRHASYLCLCPNGWYGRYCDQGRL